jgi:hypothetical protein
VDNCSSQAVDFFNHIWSFLAYGGSSTVKTLNQPSFHMRRMVRFQVEISAIVGGFTVDSGGQCLLFPDDQNIKVISLSISVVNWMEGPKLLRWLRKSCNLDGP